MIAELRMRRTEGRILLTVRAMWLSSRSEVNKKNQNTAISPTFDDAGVYIWNNETRLLLIMEVSISPNPRLI